MRSCTFSLRLNLLAIILTPGLSDAAADTRRSELAWQSLRTGNGGERSENKQKWAAKRLKCVEIGTRVSAGEMRTESAPLLMEFGSHMLEKRQVNKCRSRLL